MADRDTMMNPPIEDLLDKVDSKFTLVSLAAKRGRQINSYFNQLGEGLGAIVPPQWERGGIVVGPAAVFGATTGLVLGDVEVDDALEGAAELAQRVHEPLRLGQHAADGVEHDRGVERHGAQGFADDLEEVLGPRQLTPRQAGQDGLVAGVPKGLAAREVGGAEAVSQQLGLGALS